MKNKIMTMLFVLLSIMSISCTSVVSKAAVIRETDLEDYIQQELPKAHALGMAISIVSAEKELYCAAYGMAQNTEADYELGALSKTLTAVGIMRMVEDSDISLEDNVSDYTSDYPGFEDITIQELLSQTSGIAYEQTGSEAKIKGTAGKFEDANLNYNILGDIIESVSGMSYEEYISDNVLDPLEMSSTYSLRHDPELGEDMMTGYQSYFGFPFATKNAYSEDDKWMKASSSYMISDVKDIGKYLQMYLKKDEAVLSKESIKTILRGTAEIPVGSAMSEDMFGGSAKYGMGWIQKEVDGNKILYASGRTENYTATMVLLPRQDLGITMMFNCADSLVGDKLIEKLEEGIISIELGKEPEKANGNTYLINHGIYDALMVFAVIAAWIPIFRMSVWCKKRRQKLLNVPGIVGDILVNVVLPTVLLFVLPTIVPVHIAKKFIPDVYYIICVVIGSLYLGAIIKVVASIVLGIMGPKEEEAEAAEKVEAVDEEAKESDKEGGKAKAVEESDKEEDKVKEADQSDKEEDKSEKNETSDTGAEKAEEPEDSEKSEAAVTEEAEQKDAEEISAEEKIVEETDEEKSNEKGNVDEM